jgi:D-serine deaminase-like pyridoxal phosphate-dependent protein
MGLGYVLGRTSERVIFGDFVVVDNPEWDRDLCPVKELIRIEVNHSCVTFDALLI